MSARKVWRRQRETPRAQCRLRVRLFGASRVADGAALDLSRTGLRLRLRLGDLGIPSDVGLFDLGRFLRDLLGETCMAELRHATEPRSATKAVRFVRIGYVKRTAGEMDLGCRFDEALSDAEIGTLGLALPTVDDVERQVG